MATVEYIEVKFLAASSSEGTKEHTESFDPADSGLQSTVDTFAEEWVDELNEDLEDSDDEYDFEEYEVKEYDEEFADPTDFDNLDEYGEYAELVEEFGEAYSLYYEDRGECTKNDFEDHYAGCWRDAEEFAENYVDDCMEVPVSMASYFDYEKFARDLMMDYSSYGGSDGFHIFRNY